MIKEIKTDCTTEYIVSIPTTRATIKYGVLNGKPYRIIFQTNDFTKYKSNTKAFALEDYNQEYMSDFIDLMAVIIESIKSNNLK